MELKHRALELGDFLETHGALWCERPFVRDRLSWEEQHPDLVGWLTSLTPVAISTYERDPARLIRETPPPISTWAGAARRLTTVQRFSSVAPSPWPSRLSWRVPRRKQQQVNAFVEAITILLPGAAPIVDWCAGKGHLARTLALRSGREVACVEQSPALCQTGEQLDRRAGVHCRWLNIDIHEARAHRLLHGASAVALHACGELHRELVVSAPQRGAVALALAPCCYHRERHGNGHRERSAKLDGERPLSPPPPVSRYEPLSSVLRRARLRPDEHALRLATAAEVVASSRVVREREREQVFRLGLDLLLRQATGEDRYHSLPPLPARWLRQGFPSLVEQVSAALDTPLSRGDLHAVEQQAWARLHRVRALGLVRGLFRRPLELWLALDVALYLEEQGYRVQLGTFCPREVTPRNLLVFAARDRPAEPLVPTTATNP